MSDLQGRTYDQFIPVTPSDSTPQFTSPAAGFIVYGAGDVTIVRGPAGNTVTGKINALAGVIYNIAFTQIKNTGTTATGILALSGSGFKAAT